MRRASSVPRSRAAACPDGPVAAEEAHEGDAGRPVEEDEDVGRGGDALEEAARRAVAPLRGGADERDGVGEPVEEPEHRTGALEAGRRGGQEAEPGRDGEAGDLVREEAAEDRIAGA